MELALLVVGKAQRPRVFLSVKKLPVHYAGQKSAWVIKAIFLDWLNVHFISEVKKYLSEKCLPLKALLLIDNAPAHPLKDLQSIDKNFTVLYISPNCTALIQPMDQSVILNIKVTYKKQLRLQVFGQQEVYSECTLNEILKKTL